MSPFRSKCEKSYKDHSHDQDSYICSVIDLIDNNKDAIKQLCKAHFVKALFLFGSATTDNFIPGTSDLDFVVEFKDDVDPVDFADNFFSLLDSLKTLFNSEVDLLSYRALKNQVIINEVERSKVSLYAA